MAASPSRFELFFLPGLAFKAVVIGGGYATGRELTTFLIPSGPRGGLQGMVVALLIWSLVCVLTYLFAFRTRRFDYRTFFKQLLGPAWPLFEVAYFLSVTVILAVYAVAAGSIGSALFGTTPVPDCGEPVGGPHTAALGPGENGGPAVR